MNMQEFYERYNLNKYNFASIAGVGTRSLTKFAEEKPLRDSTKARIEKAMRVIEKHDLVRPKYDYGKGIHSMIYKNEFNSEVRKYETFVKELIEMES